MSAGFRRHVVGKTLRNVCSCVTQLYFTGSFPVRKRTGTLKIWRAREREPIWGSGSGGFRGYVRGLRPHPLGVLQKNSGSTNLENSETADGTIIIITNFYLAASSHEIFLRVGGREGMKGLGALQRHQLPHPLQKSWIRHWGGAPSGVQGQTPWSGRRSPPEAEGILLPKRANLSLSFK